MLSAISVILSYFEFMMSLSPEFAKMDFSDLPALLAAFAYSPVAELGVEVIKNVLGLLSIATGGID
jgi:riboflavin transporter